MKPKKKTDLPARIPTHIAIIMDGNGRWARARGLPRLAGHRAGTENLRRVIQAAVEFGIQYLTVYAFSTENWDRPKDEVQGLMKIFEGVIDRELQELYDQGVQIRHVGRLDRLSSTFRKKILKAIEFTKNNHRLILNIAFNYGGRDEILHVIQEMIRKGVKPEEVTESLVEQYLFTAGTPCPDLIFPAVYWPDFDKEQLRRALEEYSRRDRRYGRVRTDEDPCHVG
jgi:undecaprenyl diphosphate synthase